jgi:LacI family transcriptional regulator
MKPSVKMSDIARELGVSTVTVSKALTGKDGVSSDLRKLITHKAAEMGYVYNSLPRNMRAGRNYAIGIVIPAKYLGETSFYWVFYQRLLSVLKQTSYLGTLEIISNDDEAAGALPAIVTANKIDGLFSLGQLSNTYLTAITSRQNQKCIFLDFYSEIGNCDCVAANNIHGSYDLTKLLIAAGHKRIGFIGSIAATTSILDRYLGFCKAMLEAGLSYESAIPDRDAMGTYIDITLHPDIFTAYVCNNDQIAGIAIRQLERQGLRVPEDVSIVGFDNDDSMITAGIGITSLAVNVPLMCELTVDLLMKHIESADYVPRGKSFIDGRIVVKQSIAPPAR